MTLDQFLNLLATSLGAIGSVYVLKSLVSLTPDLSAKLTATYFDYSRPQIESLAQQRGESIAGAAAVIAALCLALINAALADNRPLFQSRGRALATVGMIVVVLFALMHGSAVLLRHRHSLATRKRIVGAHVARLIDQRTLEPSYVDSACSYARNLLGVTIDPASGRRRVLVQVAAAAGDILSPESLPPDELIPK